MLLNVYKIWTFVSYMEGKKCTSNSVYDNFAIYCRWANMLWVIQIICCTFHIIVTIDLRFSLQNVKLLLQISYSIESFICAHSRKSKIVLHRDFGNWDWVNEVSKKVSKCVDFRQFCGICGSFSLQTLKVPQTYCWYCSSKIVNWNFDMLLV